MESVALSNFEEYECFSSDSLSDFINMMKQYPKATDESNRRLLSQYRKGDMEARDLLIKTNVRLVISQAKRYTTSSYELLDVINEGIIGFIKAIDSYDETKGEAKFSTFAVTCIRNYISNSLSKYDLQIRKPKNVAAEVRDYYRITKVCMEEGRKLTDDECCSLLDVKPERLKLIRADYRFNTSSLNEKVGDGEDSEVGDFIAIEDTSFASLLNSMEDNSLMVALKLMFPPHYYYVLYNRILSSNPQKQTTIAKKLHLSRGQISNIERACLDKLKTIIMGGCHLYDLKIPRDIRKRIDIINTRPLNPDWIIQYLFFRDVLEEEERRIFKLLITSMYLPNEVEFSKELNMSLATYRMFYASLIEKISIKDAKTKTIYEEFYNNIMNKYGSKIFTIDLDEKLADMITDAAYVSKVWDDFTYSEAMDIIVNNQLTLTPCMNDLLERYFDGGRERFTLNTAFKRRAEREVNAILFGFHYRNETTITGLYDALISNKHRFTLDQHDYLMSRKFGQDNLRERGIKSVTNLGDLRDLSRRLEKIYFGISNYREINFTKEKYESVRDICYKTANLDKNSILDMYYGVGVKKLSISEIASKLDVSYEEAKHKIREAKEYALRIYLGRNNARIVDKSLYVPYVLDESIRLSDRTRTMLREFLIENKSYEELAILHHLTKDKRKVSSIIGEGLLTIDFYRFGIFTKSSNYMSEECRAIFESLTLTSEEREVIQLKFEGKTKEEIISQTNLTFIRVSYILNKFYRLCDESRIASIQIDDNDIRREVEAHISERVLNEKERLLLSKLYGVICDTNPTGIRYTEEEFRLAHPEMSKQFKKYLRAALDTIRSKKAGFTKASLAYMSREDLSLSLKDPRIPISRVERELLCYSFELNGYPYKTLKELGEIYGELPATLKEKIERSFVTIYKYENDEIMPSVSYEDDVEPFLKYFSKADQEILKDYYDAKATFSLIEKKHGLAKGQIESLTLRLESQLRDFMDGNENGFDFNYFYSVINNPDIPFYGDKEKTLKVFRLYYEKRMSASEIISKLGLTCKESVVMRSISELMIAVCKYRIGIRKVRTYTPLEVQEYYEKNSTTMDLEQQRIYLKYFTQVMEDEKESSLRTYSKPNLPSEILLDMIADNHENLFSFENTSRQEVLEILRKHRNLSNTTRYTIFRAYHIHQRELMSGSEKMKVLRFLAKLNVRSKTLTIRKSA